MVSEQPHSIRETINQPQKHIAMIKGTRKEKLEQRLLKISLDQQHPCLEYTLQNYVHQRS